MKTHSEILNRAAELIDAGWTRGVFARNKLQLPVTPYDPDATCFCALGAIQRAAYEAGLGDTIVAELATATLITVGRMITVSDWNDKIAKSACDVSNALRQTAARLQR